MAESRYDIGEGVYVQAGGDCGPTWVTVRGIMTYDRVARLVDFRETWPGWDCDDGFATFEQADACAKAFAEKERDG